MSYLWSAMLVILTEDQILSTEAVCKHCLLADQTGHPRWRQGRLVCGKTFLKSRHRGAKGQETPRQYQCQMGFRVTQVR